MSIEDKKKIRRKIQKVVDEIDDIQQLKEIQKLIDYINEQPTATDFWTELSAAQKVSAKKGLEQIRTGQSKSHHDVISKYR